MLACIVKSAVNTTHDNAAHREEDAVAREAAERDGVRVRVLHARRHAAQEHAT